MKKFSIIWLIIALIIIVLLFVFFSNQTYSNDIFLKKQQCVSYREDAEKMAEENMFRGSGFVDRVFYSPKLNTCLYAVWGWYEIEADFENWAIIVDALTGKTVWEYNVKTSELNGDINFREQILDKVNEEIDSLD